MARAINPFSDVGTTEKVARAFDFANGLAPGEALTGTPAVKVEVAQGVDDTPSTRLLTTPAVSGTQIVFLVGEMLDGVTYRLVATCATTQGQTLSLWQYQTCSGP